MAVHPYPLRGIAAASLATSYVLVAHASTWWKLGYISTFASAGILQSLIWVFWVVILWPKLFSPLRSLPEPSGNSWFNGQWDKIRRKPTGMPMREWVAAVPNEGVMRYLGLFNSEQALAEVLVTKNYDFEKPASWRHTIGRILGVGILLAEGDEHKRQRKNLMPAFAFRHVKDLYPTFWSKTREGVDAMVRDIRTETANQPNEAPKSAVIEVGTWTSRVALDIIGVAGLGRDFGAIKDQNSELMTTYRRLFSPNRQAQILALLGMVFPERLLTLLPVNHNNNINHASEFIRSVCRGLIADKKQKMARKEPTEHDILSVALESGGFTDEELVDQLMTFLAAGHETTATSMTWAIYQLAKMPEVQEKLRKEIHKKLPSIDSNTDITSMDIDHMPYLNAVCNEVMRYWAPVPMTLRDTARETTILGHVIPKGVRVIMSPAATHFDTELWGPDAAEFNPDRWMPTASDDKRAASGGAESNYAFVTFLHGPRSCIGSSFARAEFACILAGWIGRFAFELKNKEEMDEKNVEVKGGITARPSKGMYVHATIIDGW
ncbi:cytochrome P450 [Xylariaceae sp. FL1272]|nr:cytochrome P450 [Xylariaceae sp. FL1272]